MFKGCSGLLGVVQGSLGVCSVVQGCSGLSRVLSAVIKKTQRKKFCTLLDLCVSSLRRGHANLLCIVPILTDDPRRESKDE